MKAWVLGSLVWLFVTPARAALTVDTADPSFAAAATRFLKELETASDPLRQLVAKARQAPRDITVFPITDDKKTWHWDGDRTRSHTDPIDKRRGPRKTKVAARIFLYPPRVLQHPQRATLAHELTHAIDYTYALHQEGTQIQERRAAFFENAWRDLHGQKLRRLYHGRFPVTDYQIAKAAGRIPEYVTHILSKDGFP
jgi:hypothetical protein